MSRHPAPQPDEIPGASVVETEPAGDVSWVYSRVMLTEAAHTKVFGLDEAWRLIATNIAPLSCCDGMSSDDPMQVRPTGACSARLCARCTASECGNAHTFRARGRSS